MYGFSFLDWSLGLPLSCLRILGLLPLRTVIKMSTGTIYNDLQGVIWYPAFLMLRRIEVVSAGGELFLPSPMPPPLTNCGAYETVGGRYVPNVSSLYCETNARRRIISQPVSSPS